MRELVRTGVAREHGYFPADHDDRVKRMVLDYRQVRLELWEVILRYQGYAEITDPARRLQAFMLAFAAGLSLYGKSLLMVETFEHVPFMRAKLNEPDAKYGLEANFFEQLLRGYSSLEYYRILAAGTRYWRRNRRLVADLALAERPGWEWLPEHISAERRVVRQRFWHVLRTRLRRDWRALWQTVSMPLGAARYNLQALVGSGVAKLHYDAHHQPSLDARTLAELRSLVRPGDVLLTRAEGKLTAALLPGFWAHAAINLGGRDQLAPLGIAQHPAVVPHWENLPAAVADGAAILEAVSPRVRIDSDAVCLAADHVCVLRPTLPDAEIAAALINAMGHYGKLYDFDFDFDHATRLVCTGLVYRTFHGRGAISLELIKRLGRWTLSVDDLLNQCLAAHARAGAANEPVFHPVALVLTGPDRVPRFVPTDEIVPQLDRIQAGWRPFAAATA